MTLRVAISAGLLALAASGAQAEFAKVESQSDFVRLIDGKTLSRPLIRLQVHADGRIEGRGAGWDVSGSWRWRNGYFCRDLSWGGDDLGYNCQEVRAYGRKVRFTSDRGEGDSADFRLR